MIVILTESKDRNELYGEIFLKPNVLLNSLESIYNHTIGASFADVGA
jgi:hypothetical protein